MRYTLLEMVQNILSSMDSDEVTSINDTTESRQVAELCRTTYFDMVNRGLVPEQYVVTELELSTNITVLQSPENFEDLKWIKYDCASAAQVALGETNILTMQFLPIKEFLDRSDRLGTRFTTDTTIEEISFKNDVLEPGGGNTTYYVTNNAPPRYYTASRDRFIIFDSYDALVDPSGLDPVKSVAYMRRLDDWTFEDTYQPYLDDAQFQLWLNESKALAWLELKQAPHPIAERNAKRGWSQSQRSKIRVKGCSDFDQLPNFGRKGYQRYG